MWAFSIATAVVALLSGIAAAIAGAGIGSALAPLFFLRVELALAIAAASIPHMVGSALRLWTMRHRIDRQVLIRFGVLSAAGGLLGAWLQRFVYASWLTGLFGGLLCLAGLLGALGVPERLRFGRVAAWASGALSGFLGGLVGEQGGFRAIALLGFGIPKEAFVATAAAIALVGDAARVPVYLITHGAQLQPLWTLIAAATASVIIGTLAGGHLLRHISQQKFSRVVSGIILVIGALMFVRMAAAR